MKIPLMALPFLLVALPAASALDYEKDIMPILVEKCSDCHSSKAEKVKAGLRFDNPEHFQKRFAKNDVVIPGDFDASYLFVTLFRPPEDKEAMPPKGKGERLTVEEIVLVLEWIAEGAPINGTRGDRGPKPESYEALFADLGTRPGPMVGEAKAVAEDWTNAEGVTITATLIRVEDGEALLRLKDGRVTRYPVAKFSEESQARIAKRAE